jgi:hypothetical protein
MAAERARAGMAKLAKPASAIERTLNAAEQARSRHSLNHQESAEQHLQMMPSNLPKLIGR